MGNGVFLFRAQLRHGAGIPVRLKHGVITEAIFPARRKQDTALAGAAGAQTSTASAVEARLPLIFDDSFAMYDEQRLASALRYITEIHHGQILLFTCHTREQRILENEDVKFNLIEM